MADYNAKVMSLLGTDVVPEGTINRSNTYEQLYTVSGRQIICPTEMMGSAGVTEDTCAEVLRFRVSRFWDGHDLAQHTGKILFINAAGESDEQQILEAEISDTCINFEWCLDSRVTKQAGPVNFALRFETIDTEAEEIIFRWTTLPCTLTISAGLAWTDGEIAATYPSILEQWLQNMTNIEANVNDLIINAGNKITDSAEATAAATEAAEKANTAATEANNATALANAAIEAANNATAAANAAAANTNTITETAINNIVEAKNAAITAKGEAAEAATNANNAAGVANTAADNANAAKEAAEAATADLTKIKEDATLAIFKANNVAEYPLHFAYEISALQVGTTFKKNNIYRLKEDFATKQGVIAGLYICRVNYVYTDTAVTFKDLLNDYTFTFVMDECKGDKGDKGDTPVIGVDYYTEAEKTALAEEIKTLVLTEVDSQLDELNGEVV